MTRPRKITIAACAPASFGFVPETAVAATERAIKGLVTDGRAMAEHVDRMLDHHLRVLEKAAGGGPDLAVIPEDALRLSGFVRRHGRESWCARVVADACRRYVERVGGFCRAHRCCVVGGTVTSRRGRYYNTAVMQDAAGRVVACYDKTHLPRNPQDDERHYLTPGSDLPVFDTPLGRIGFLICWDIVFPETFAVLALKGAELVVQPTFGHADELSDVVARCRCHDWSVPMAISMWGRNACIVNHAGTIVAHTGALPDSVATATVTLGAPRTWAYLTDAAPQLRGERRPVLYRALTSTRRGRNACTQRRTASGRPTA